MNLTRRGRRTWRGKVNFNDCAFGIYCAWRWIIRLQLNREWTYWQLGALESDDVGVRDRVRSACAEFIKVCEVAVDQCSIAINDDVVEPHPRAARTVDAAEPDDNLGLKID